MLWKILLFLLILLSVVAIVAIIVIALSRISSHAPVPIEARVSNFVQTAPCCLDHLFLVNHQHCAVSFEFLVS
jgi:hypothetical protein